MHIFTFLRAEKSTYFYIGILVLYKTRIVIMWIPNSMKA